MALQYVRHDPHHLRAIVDMGSNGIRFSISTLQPPTTRIMPTLYQHRVGISLYDAQYSASNERQPIDDITINAVVTAFKQFRRTCRDFAVPEENITILATEATRTAINSEDFRKQIKDAVGWEVKMLAKEDEGRIGALGIASSLPDVAGLVMDLGGGSTQLSWLICDGAGGGVQMPDSGSVSMPYGAAAMSRRLAEAERDGTTSALKKEVESAVKSAYDSLKIPEQLKKLAAAQGGFTLYLSGGGFRGWGYLLMSRHRVQPYPVPVINGFMASRHEFMGIDEVKAAAAATLANEDDAIFRVSDRRASQVPAVAFLVNVLADVLPEIKQVRFCQGGVREGYLFSLMESHLQADHPLTVATRPFGPEAHQAASALIVNALPSATNTSTQDPYEQTFTPPILEGLANMMYYHSSHSKDLQGSAALRCTTSGVLAGVHGLLHEHRTLLALLLCARWGGDVPPTDEVFKRGLEFTISSPWQLWWINYLGAVAALIGAVYPAGVSNEGGRSRMTLNARWTTAPEHGTQLSLNVTLTDDVELETFAKEVKNIEKVGKKKHWIGGKGGIGYRVEVETSRPPP